MKKNLALLAALLASLAVSGNVRAQHFAGRRAGLIGGFTSSSSNIDKIDTKSVSVYHIGLTAEFPLGCGFALQPSLVYQVKGLSFDRLSDDHAVEPFVRTLGENAKVGYIELPVQVQWGPDLMVFRPYVFAEPFMGYRVSQPSVLEDGNSSAGQTKFDLRKIEYGAALGAGLEVWRAQLSVKYFWNFGKMCEEGVVKGEVREALDGGPAFTPACADLRNEVRGALNKGHNFNGIQFSLALFF